MDFDPNYDVYPYIKSNSDVNHFPSFSFKNLFAFIGSIVDSNMLVNGESL